MKSPILTTWTVSEFNEIILIFDEKISKLPQDE